MAVEVVKKSLINVIGVGRLHHPPKRSHIQPRVLEIEVALEPKHDVVVDDSVMAQGDDRSAFRFEQLPPQSLIIERTGLDRAVVSAVEPSGIPAAPKSVQAAEPLSRILAHPVLVHELVEPSE